MALVTGASRGIGRAIAQALAAQGMQGHRHRDHRGRRARRSARRWPALPGGRGVVLDVNDGAALDAASTAIVKEHGGLHVLVNNAGITRDTLAMRMKDDDWDAVLDTNLKAVFRACRAVMRAMMKQRYGRIVNITSVVGASGNAGQANYAAAKAGVAGMTRALARELGSRDITVNCVAPGFIDTDMTEACPRRRRPRCWRRSRWAGWARRRKSRTRWPSWPRRGPATSPAPNCTSTAACS